MSAATGMRPVPRARYRLILVSDTYPPVVGGAEMDAQRVSAELNRRGHQVNVLCSGGAPMPPVREWVDDAGVAVTILTREEQGRWKHVLFAIRVGWTIWRKRRDFEVLFIAMSGLHLASGLLVGRMLKKRIVSKMHGSTVITGLTRSPTGRLELRWLRKWAARVLVLNDEMVQEALDAGIPPAKLMHMPNPIDTDAFSPVGPDTRAELRAQLGIPAQAQVLLYSGRLSHEKGLVWLLDAFARAAAELPRAMLVLVGDGPMRAALEQQARDLGVADGKVHFAGRVQAAAVPKWLRTADAFALVSPNEGFSCALAEAMATGLPSVVSAIPANVQLIDEGAHGYTAPPGEIEATATAIRRLLSDEEGRERMGLAARQRVVENYSLGQIADRYEALFAEILEPEARP